MRLNTLSGRSNSCSVTIHAEGAINKKWCYQFDLPMWVVVFAQAQAHYKCCVGANQNK